MIDLDALKAAQEKAAKDHPLPWRVEWNPDNDGRRVSDADGDCVAAWTWVACYPSGAVFDGLDEEDAEAIVLAVNSLPKLFEEVARSRQEAATWEAEEWSPEQGRSAHFLGWQGASRILIPQIDQLEKALEKIAFPEPGQSPVQLAFAASQIARTALTELKGKVW